MDEMRFAAQTRYRRYGQEYQVQALLYDDCLPVDREQDGQLVVIPQADPVPATQQGEIDRVSPPDSSGNTGHGAATPGLFCVRIHLPDRTPEDAPPTVLILAPGLRYRHDGVWYRVRALLPRAEVLIEREPDGPPAIAQIGDLHAAWEAGRLDPPALTLTRMLQISLAGGFTADTALPPTRAVPRYAGSMPADEAPGANTLAASDDMIAQEAGSQAVAPGCSLRGRSEIATIQRPRWLPPATATEGGDQAGDSSADV